VKQLFSYPANRQTDRLTDKRRLKHAIPSWRR